MDADGHLEPGEAVIRIRPDDVIIHEGHRYQGVDVYATTEDGQQRAVEHLKEVHGLLDPSEVVAQATPEERTGGHHFSSSNWNAPWSPTGPKRPGGYIPPDAANPY